MSGHAVSNSDVIPSEARDLARGEVTLGTREILRLAGSG